MTEIIDLCARRQGRQLDPEPARLSDRIEGLMAWARLEIEDLVPMTRMQRIALTIIFERVLDQIDALDPPPPENSGNAA